MILQNNSFFDDDDDDDEDTGFLTVSTPSTVHGRRNQETRDPSRFQRYNHSIKVYDTALKHKSDWLYSKTGSAYYINNNDTVLDYSNTKQTLKNVDMIGVLPRNKHGTASFLEDGGRNVVLFHPPSGSVVTVDEITVVNKPFKRSTASYMFSSIKFHGTPANITPYLKWIEPASISTGRESKILG